MTERETIEIIQGPTPDFELQGTYNVDGEPVRDENTNRPFCVALVRLATKDRKGIFERYNRALENDIPLVLNYPAFSGGGVRREVRIVNAFPDDNYDTVIQFRVVLSPNDIEDLGLSNP